MKAKKEATPEVAEQPKKEVKAEKESHFLKEAGYNPTPSVPEEDEKSSKAAK